MNLRHDLPPMIPRIAKLPLSERGYPVPYFVQWVNGKEDFRIMDGRKLLKCVHQMRCWICGDRLSTKFTFVSGPMCGVNRTSAEPPSHCDCAEWAVRACPFMVKPQMVRREDELSRANAGNVAGIPIARNPGIGMLWETRSYSFRKDDAGKLLFRMGPAERVTWWREGRAATREEVKESIRTGLPHLEALCTAPDDFAALASACKELEAWLPK